MRSSLTANRIISQKDLKRLLAETKREKDNYLATGNGERYVNDYFLFQIASNTALRISEVAALKWQDIGDDWLVLQNGKGGKCRTVPSFLKTRYDR